MNPHGHWFWWLITMGVVAWYLSMTGVVAVLGFKDIRRMLRALTEDHLRDEAQDESGEG